MTKQFWSKFFLSIKLILLFGIIFVLYQLPGYVVIQWSSFEVEISSSFLALTLFALLLGLIFIHRLYLSLKNIPRKWRLYRQQRRHVKVHRALFGGFNALAAEDYQEAKDQIQKLERLESTNPFHLILKTQVAFALGYLEEAENCLKDLSKHPDLGFLGLRGLITLEEQRRNHHNLNHLLMEALKLYPESPWILEKIFDWNIRHAMFDQAEIILEQLQITHTQTPQTINRRKALLSWAEAEVAYREQDFDVFYQAVHRALALVPGLTEATFRLAQYYGESQRFSKALKTLYKGYTAQPNPEYGVILQQVFTNTSALDLYKEAEKITESHSNHRYTHQILAQLAIEAKLWGQAKNHLESLKKFTLTKTYYQLMALLESRQHPEQPHLAQNWLDQSALAPMDASWVCTACAHSHDRWALTCSSCHQIDTVSWDGIPSRKQSSPLLLENYPTDINKFLAK